MYVCIFLCVYSCVYVSICVCLSGSQGQGLLSASSYPSGPSAIPCVFPFVSARASHRVRLECLKSSGSMPSPAPATLLPTSGHKSHSQILLSMCVPEEPLVWPVFVLMMSEDLYSAFLVFSGRLGACIIGMLLSPPFHWQVFL